MLYLIVNLLLALQVQNMWAYENNVVLLSSGASNPKVGSGGTGIFIGLSLMNR